MYQHTSILELEVSLSCHGRRARLSPRAISPSPSKKNSGLENPRWGIYIDFLREINGSYFDRWKRKLKEILDEMRVVDQRAGSLEHDARQPRLAMEADGPVNIKTYERTEGAATAVEAMHGDSCTAQKVQDGPKTSTSFGMKVKPPALFCRDDVLVENDDASPKPCLSPVEVRKSTPADGLLHAGSASSNKAQGTNNFPPEFLP